VERPLLARPLSSASFPVRDYNLAATLTSGQAFRWRAVNGTWEGVLQNRWVRLHQAAPHSPDAPHASIIEATTDAPPHDWRWLTDYLRLDDDHAAALATFPDDKPMRTALAHCRGLRLLRQNPWECLASFILSSTKQIVQIQQCVELLCERFGEPIRSGAPAERRQISDHRSAALCRDAATPNFAFPTAARLASASEIELRECKIGFRAKYLLAAARMVASAELDLAKVQSLPLDAARAELMRCPGVGRKIADCTLLFSCGFDAAFPIDVWVERALQQLYFAKRRAKRARLEHFAATHFGPHAGLAQQYLFHYLRVAGKKELKR